MPPLDSPLPEFRLAHPELPPRLTFAGTMPTDNLTERYRPWTLADIVAQGATVFQLADQHDPTDAASPRRREAQAPFRYPRPARQIAA